ncbi:hypothetical protein OH77DRAFT_978862 [Trametes cingulata]|nr:hypothetical protein OH77DRAFT_978862 [Trametes cingulata]
MWTNAAPVHPGLRSTSGHLELESVASSSRVSRPQRPQGCETHPSWVSLPAAHAPSPRTSKVQVLADCPRARGSPYGYSTIPASCTCQSGFCQPSTPTSSPAPYDRHCRHTLARAGVCMRVPATLHIVPTCSIRTLYSSNDRLVTGTYLSNQTRRPNSERD